MIIALTRGPSCPSGALAGSSLCMNHASRRAPANEPRRIPRNTHSCRGIDVTVFDWLGRDDAFSVLKRECERLADAFPDRCGIDPAWQRLANRLAALQEDAS